MNSLKELKEEELREKLEQMRSELVKLRVQAAKGTLRKESGKLKPLRRNIARIMTRLNQM